LGSLRWSPLCCLSSAEEERGTGCCVELAFVCTSVPTRLTDQQRRPITDAAIWTVMMLLLLSTTKWKTMNPETKVLRCLSTQNLLSPFIAGAKTRSAISVAHRRSTATGLHRRIQPRVFQRVGAGGQAGDTYYQLLACEVNRRKLTRSNSSGP
jgi:hypothetical protein